MSHDGQLYTAQLDLPGINISIPIDFKQEGPNCFFAPPPSVSPVKSGEWIGDTQQGGSLNFKTIKVNPHGNGTHTECVGHISSEWVTINHVLNRSHFVGQLVSLHPTLVDSGDRVITADQIKSSITTKSDVLIIRTLPNHGDKQRRIYSGTNPPYIEDSALAYLRDLGVIHLIVDLPSVDREEDGGLLAAHKAWWNYPETLDEIRTITEMVYIPPEVSDGLYLTDIQALSIELDASPSTIKLYPLTALNL